MGLEALKVIRDEYQAKIRAEGEVAMKESLKGFFAANPTIAEVKWTQYTPHFNDGEACIFSLHGIEAKINGEEDFKDEYDLRKSHPDEAKALAELEALLEGSSEVLESVLGDHAEVTASADKVEVEEYDHD